MKDRIGMADTRCECAEKRLRRNVQALMDWRRMTQAELAARLGKSQSWVSKRLSGTSRFQFEDLDAIADIFVVSPADLLRETYENWDRRNVPDRRSGVDRRRTAPHRPEPPEFTEGDDYSAARPYSPLPSFPPKGEEA